MKVLYSSIQDPASRDLAERAIRAAIGDRPGEWWVSLVAPPRQPLWAVSIDGPNGYTRTWAFEETDQHYAAIRQTISCDLIARS